MTRTTIEQLGTKVEQFLDRAAKDERASKVVKGAMQLKDRVDDLAKRVTGLEAMEKRIAQLEGRIAKLERAKRRPPSSSRKTA
jgi:cell division septum initiation protein DivIVA